MVFSPVASDAGVMNKALDVCSNWCIVGCDG